MTIEPLENREMLNGVMDYGDAPDPSYPTLLASNGARHTIVSGFHLGASVDSDSDGQPHQHCLGDDLDGNVDDDGVFFQTSVIPGQSFSIQVVLTDSLALGGKLDAWIDWNQDGTWGSGEQIFTNQSLSAGSNTFMVAVPGSASFGYAPARFRLSSAGGLAATGAAANGEVEDYAVLVKKNEGLDFGDAPDPTYPTWSGPASVGAVHQIVSGYYLGSSVDFDADGQPSAHATGDDSDESDDEDGVQLLTPIIPGHYTQVRVTASAAGILNAWLDGNSDGDWDEPGEHFAVDLSLTAGINDLTFFVPDQVLATDSTFARFRFSSVGGLDYRGYAPDGEVEDYEFSIQGSTTDSLVGRSSSTGQWLMARSNGSSFTNSSWGTWSTSVTWSDVVTGDFNGDGYADLAGRISTTGDWWIAKSNGTSSFVNERWGKWNPSSSWVNVLVADVNGDGNDDILGRISSTGDWWAAVSNGTNGFINQRWGKWSTASNWVDVQVADVNGDHSDDLIGRLASTGDWWVAVSNGMNAFSNQRWGKWNPSSTWVDVRVGDVNGDGFDDIIGRISSTGDWWVAASNGMSAFTIQRWGRWSAASNWLDVNVGDFDGDGNDDVLGRIAATGDWWVAMSNGVSAFVNQRWAGWSVSVNWIDVRVGDFNGDGADDVAGRIASTGDWWVGVSNGINQFINQRWGRWSTSTTWLDVRSDSFAHI